MPTEVHEHYDADGNYTGKTVVTRESEWDDETRERALNLTAYDESLCACGCGLPVTESHKDQPYKVHAIRCYARRALDKRKRQAAEEAKRNKAPDGWNDGVHYFVEPFEPGGDS